MSDSNDFESNPFVLFRRFIDDEARALFSAFGTLRPHVERSLEDVERSHHAAWKRLSDSYERTMNPEKTSIQPRTGDETKSQDSKAQMPLQQITDPSCNHPQDHAENNNGLPKSQSFNPYDPDAVAPAWTTSGSLHWEYDLATRICRPTSDFFRRDFDYSPLALEYTPFPKNRADTWRAAFRDLLASQQGRDLADFAPPTKYEDSGTWIQRLQREGLASRWSEDLRAHVSRTKPDEEEIVARLPEGFYPGEILRSFRAKKDHQEDGEERQTELDYHEQYLEVTECPASNSAAHTEQSPIISCLQTTEARRLPDGTVFSKTVWKHRFADGTEQVEETEETWPPSGYEVPPGSHNPPTPSSQEKPVSAALDDPKQKPRSWFWSSS